MNNNQQTMLDESVSVLEKCLGIKRTAFSFVERLSENLLAVGNGKSLLEYIDTEEHKP